MNQEELYHRLITDAKLLNLPIDEVDLFLRPYSQTYYGRYFPSRKEGVTPRIYLYPFSDKSGELMPYDDVLDTLIHEMVHHIQYCDKCFKRKKGIMHDTQFWKLYNHYVNRAVSLSLIEKRKDVAQ